MIIRIKIMIVQLIQILIMIIIIIIIIMMQLIVTVLINRRKVGPDGSPHSRLRWRPGEGGGVAAAGRGGGPEDRPWGDPVV